MVFPHLRLDFVAKHIAELLVRVLAVPNHAHALFLRPPLVPLGANGFQKIKVHLIGAAFGEKRRAKQRRVGTGTLAPSARVTYDCKSLALKLLDHFRRQKRLERPIELFLKRFQSFGVFGDVQMHAAIGTRQTFRVRGRNEFEIASEH